MKLIASVALIPLLACSANGAPEAASVEPIPTAEPALAPADFDHTHARWNKLLKARVKDDRFDYGAVKASPQEFKAYLSELQAVTPAQMVSWTEEQRFAFWINAYNAFTIEKVVDNYPIKSIRKLDRSFGLKKVFDSKFIPLKAHHPDGKNAELSLNDIEHGILRENFKDARLHAAINCASYSCPPLRGEAFIAERLDAQLEEQMRAFVADPRRNVLDVSSGKLQLSEIFKWFSDDFERDASSVRAYVKHFAPKDKQAFIDKAKIKYIDYSWTLNDAKS